MTSSKSKFLLLIILICIILQLPAAEATTILKEGSRGSDVLILQQQLKSLAYFEVTPTGYFGPITEKAVIKLQKDYYLKQDGIVGPKTNQLIHSLLDKSKRSFNKKEVLAFYVCDEPNIPSSFATLKQQSNKITSISPFWYRLDQNSPGNLEVMSYVNKQESNEVISFSKNNNIKNYALIHNLLYGQSSISKDVVHTVFSDPNTRWKLVMNIFNLLKSNGFNGVCVDIENIHTKDRGLYIQFLAELAAQLKPAGYSIIASVPSRISDTNHGGWGDNFNYQEVAKYADMVVVMAYDEHTGGSNSGPIASISYVEKVIKYTLSKIPPEKIVLGVAGYGFDWNYGNGSSRYISYQMAMKTAEKYKKSIQWDSQNQVPYYSYTDNNKHWHSVYFENASSLASKLDLVNTYNLRGIALWRLGMEDPLSWKVVTDKFGHLK